jgi:transcriptional regulator with XRE-family HTH domain
MSSTPFGEHLRREREMRGVSLDEISAATRISTRFLEAIEKDQWDQLPGGVFNRGFIRSIARFLGLDEDSLVAEYALGTTSAASAHVSSHRPTEMPRNWRPAAAAVVIVLLIIAGGIVGYRRYGANIAARLHARYVAARAGARSGVATNEPAAPAPAAGAPNGTAAALAAPPASDAAPAGLALRMQAARPAEVKVIADGKVVFEGAVQPNDVKQFDARDNFEITSSESSALLLELNGQAMPAIGTPGQPGSVTLTRADLNAASGGSH